MNNYPRANPETYQDVTPPLTLNEIEAIGAAKERARFRVGIGLFVFIVAAVGLLGIDKLWAVGAAILLFATVCAGLIDLNNTRDEVSDFKRKEAQPLAAAAADELKDFASTDSALAALLRTWYGEGRPVNERAFTQLHRIATERRSLQELQEANAALAEHFTMGAPQ